MSHPPIAFLLGAPRSGTTLLRVMLAGHPALFVPPEMVVAPFETMAQRRARLTERFWEKGGLRRAIIELERVDVDRAKEIEASLDGLTVPEVYAWLAARCGGRMIVDKCPHLSADPPALERLRRWYPDARWLWIVRHPGSVTRSIENMPMAEVMLQGYAPDARDIWCHANRNLRSFLERVPAERQAMVRYEELVQDPKPVMERVCAALGVPFHEAVLDPYEGDRMRDGPPGARAVGDPNMAGRGRIEPELATKWLEGFDPASVGPDTHALARELGYDLGALAAPPITHVTAAIDALFDTARRLERDMRVPMDLDAVEGRRFLLRMLSASIDTFVEHGDADHPAFHHAEGPHRKMFADNPDADYLRAPIRLGDGRVYRLSGRIPPGTRYVGVQLYGKGGRISHRLDDRTLRPDADGRFEVLVSADPQPGVWLRGDGDENALFVRQYFGDRAVEAPIDVKLELLGDAPPAPPLDPRALAARLDRSRRMLERVYERTLGAYKLASTAALNRFVPIGGEDLFPTPDNTYLVCWYRFGADQVMFVRGRVPKARYFSFTLYNVWMESVDSTCASINDTRLVTAPDGTFELVLAHGGPPRPNQLDTGGHHAGYLLLRALLADGELPVPQIEVRYAREVNR